MSVHSALLHHMISYSTIRSGKDIKDKLLAGINLDFSEFPLLQERTKYSDARLIVENFYSIFGEDEFYSYGKDLVSYFSNQKEIVELFPLFSTLKYLPPIHEMNEESFKLIIGIASQLNTAHDFKLINFSPGFAEITIKKSPRYKSKKINFKLPDSIFLDCICKYHKGCMEGILSSLRAEQLRISEKFHQGRKYGNQLMPHCLYRISWKSVFNDQSQDNIVVNNINQEMVEFMSYCNKVGVSLTDLRTIALRSKNLTYVKIGEKENVSTSAIKKRFKKLFNIFGVNKFDELVKLLEEKGYFKLIENLWDK